ncbi:MAG TPA: hypothetical protein VHB30_06110, partial [Solirubrobacteraceae bacterium]|nr:hypothetical protein [Solirubrobacteraceae bacterium]
MSLWVGVTTVCLVLLAGIVGYVTAGAADRFDLSSQAAPLTELGRSGSPAPAPALAKLPVTAVLRPSV